MRAIGRVVVGTMVVLATSPAAAADIFRCREAGGGITYQQVACAGAAEGARAMAPTYAVALPIRFAQRHAWRLLMR